MRNIENINMKPLNQAQIRIIGFNSNCGCTSQWYYSVVQTEVGKVVLKPVCQWLKVKRLNKWTIARTTNIIVYNFYVTTSGTVSEWQIRKEVWIIFTFSKTTNLLIVKNISLDKCLHFWWHHTTIHTTGDFELKFTYLLSLYLIEVLLFDYVISNS